MKAVALILLIVLLSACVQKPQETPAQGEVGELGVGTGGDTGLTEMPSGNQTDESLVGEQVDLGSII